VARKAVYMFWWRTGGIVVIADEGWNITREDVHMLLWRIEGSRNELYCTAGY
jgi:hypothetical protein